MREEVERLRWERYDKDATAMWRSMRAEDPERYRCEIRVAKAARAMAMTERSHQFFRECEAEYMAAGDALGEFWERRRRERQAKVDAALAVAP